MTHDKTLTNAPLGKKSTYISQYQPDLLFPIARKEKREEIGVKSTLPFAGVDIWNAYELSWLNTKGKPVVAIGEFIVPCTSPCIIESKSFKLYLNSFNNTSFESFAAVHETLTRDLSEAAGAPINVALFTLDAAPLNMMAHLSGTDIDTLDIDCHIYQPTAELLTTENDIVTETLCSDLLKSNCLVTGQPDWGSVQISYTGKKISHESLLRYIVSFRNHNEFHEQCVERIFMDLMTRCQPEKLAVYARYTRRGGLDINPIRMNVKAKLTDRNIRLIRQ